MPNITRLQSALSILIRSVDDLIKITRLANFALYLYENIILSISSIYISIANLSKGFLYIFLQSFVFCLAIVFLSAIVLAWLARFCPCTFSLFLSPNLIIKISISFTISIFSQCLYHLLVSK